MAAYVYAQVVSDTFPVGTTVGLYMGDPPINAQAPTAGTPLIATAAVDSTGNLSLTIPTDTDDYFLGALVGSSWKYRLIPARFRIVQTVGGSGAGLPSKVQNKAANYTALSGDLVHADATAAGFTVTLPATPEVGALVAVKKIDSTPNTVTISPSGGGTIDGSANATTATQWAGAVFEHVGSNVWRIVASMSTTGPAGPTGPTGATGATGPQGPAGSPSGGWLPRVLRSGSYVTSPGQVTTLTPSRNFLYTFPFEVFTSTTFTEMVLNVTTGQASVTGRVGIYSDSSGLPGSLVIEPTTSTQLDLSTTGIKTATMSQVLAAGIYWIAFVCQNGAADPSINATQYMPVVISSATTAGAVQNSCGGYFGTAGGVTGALPGTFPGVTQQANVPRVALRTA